VSSVCRRADAPSYGSRLPLLPLRDTVLFPNVTVPLLVGRAGSLNALEEALARDRTIFAVAQKRPETAEPAAKDLYRVGTVGRVVQIFRLPDGTMRVLVEGLFRARVVRHLRGRGFQSALVSPLRENFRVARETEAMGRSVLSSFTEYVQLNRKLPEEILVSVSGMEDLNDLAHAVSAHLLIKLAVKQELLALEGLTERLKKLLAILASELEIVRLEQKIEGQIRDQVHKNQKEFYLNEQLKAIRKELGQQNEFSTEVEDLEAAVRAAGMSAEVTEKALRELDRLGKMSFMSPEAAVVRNYVEWLVSLPWKKRTADRGDMGRVEKILNQDHYGLKQVKERILEHLAVLNLSGKLRGPILCLVGPPGVGKTSLGKSIARALGRSFVRVSLGGVRDEAEIRGHRRTYVGSLPGRIIQSIRKAGTRNPVFLLDEVDKLGIDFRGDPASALLEVLDPEQNHAFSDHFLEVDFDLSEVMFITTANSLSGIPPTLRDRMEVIRLPGYLEFEKIQIAKHFLLPKQLDAAGLGSVDLKVSDEALRLMVRNYTREAGVRELERSIASICRKVAKKKTRSGAREKSFRVTASALRSYLGVPKYLDLGVEKGNRVGVATGLAWTEYGGDLLTVEVAVLPGRGELSLTGKLGEVMKESGHAALSYARSRAELLGLDKGFYKRVDIHVHVPEGAIPKDGPSAGTAIATAMVSALTGIPTRADLAMTGEITLRGSILPVGGLTEKLVVARRAELPRVIIPKDNQKDIPDLPSEVKQGLEILCLDDMDKLLKIALVSEARTLPIFSRSSPRLTN